MTWDEFEQFAFSLDLKKKKRDNVDPTKQSEWEKKADAVTRPDLAVRRRDLRLRP